MKSRSNERLLLVFLTSYTAQQVVNMGLEIYLESRDISEYFDGIIFVNPVAQLQYDSKLRPAESYPSIKKIDDRLIFIEGGIGQQNLKRHSSKFRFLWAQLSLIVTLLRTGYLRKVVLVRGEDPRVAGLYAYLFSRLLHLKLVIGTWGNPNRIRLDTGGPMTPRLFNKNQSEMRLEKFILSRAAVNLIQNRDNKEYLLSMGVSENTIEYSPLGVGISPQHYLEVEVRRQVILQESNFLKNSSPKIVFLSRLEEVKLWRDILRVAIDLRHKNLEYELFIIGDGSGREEIQEIINKEGLNDFCHVLGNRDQDWIANFLTHIDLALAPLMGRALLEIALSGSPVIAYDVDWHSEIVINDATGRLIPYGDYRGMADAVIELIQDQQKIVEMSLKIRELGLKIANPSAHKISQKRLYERLLSESG